MRDPKHLRTCDLPIKDIDASQRLRPVSEAGVDAIVASIEATGLMKDEIIVRQVRHQGDKLRLIAGGHRLAAAAELGWQTIPAKVFDCSDDWARLMEIDDNLAHAELSALELATFLAERKRVYLKAYPETAAGKAGAAGRWGDDASDTVSFASMIAEKKGISKRTVERYTAAGEALTPSTVAALREYNPTLKQLRELSDIDPEEQTRTASVLVIDGLKSVSAALAQVRMEPPPQKANPTDAAYLAMMSAWDRAPMAARRQFLAQLWEDAAELMADEAVRAARDAAG